MNKRIVLLLLVVLISIPMLASAQSGVTVSPVSVCNNSDTDITCATMLTVNFGVSYGVEQLLNIAYIDMGTDNQGNPIQVLEPTLNFEISKTEPILNYPLITLDLVAAPRASLPYLAYMVGAPQKSYTVTATVSQNGTVVNSYSISTSSPAWLDKTSVHQVLMQMGGESKSSGAPPDLSAYYFFIYKNNEMLVPSAMVPNDGDKDDLVDIGHLLDRLLREDTAYLAANPGAQPRYLVSGMKMFQGTTLPGPNNMFLQVLSPEVSYSNISLQINAAQVQAQTNLGQGYITAAAVSPNPFNSLSRDGILAVTFENARNSKTNYIVSVTSCTANMLGPIPPQALTLATGASGSLQFNLATITNTSGSNNCLVTLESTTGQVFDSNTVNFNTNVNNY
jgi:hypothetical protein